VECASEGDDPGPARQPAGHLEGTIDRLGPGVAEEDLGLGEPRRQLADPLGELDVALVVGDHRRVEQLGCLRDNGGDNLRVAVPRVGDTDARGQVEPAAAVDVHQPTALAGDGNYAEIPRQGRGQGGGVTGQPPGREL